MGFISQSELKAVKCFHGCVLFHQAYVSWFLEIFSYRILGHFYLFSLLWISCREYCFSVLRIIVLQQIFRGGITELDNVNVLDSYVSLCLGCSAPHFPANGSYLSFSTQFKCYPWLLHHLTYTLDHITLFYFLPGSYLCMQLSCSSVVWYVFLLQCHPLWYEDLSHSLTTLSPAPGIVPSTV